MIEESKVSLPLNNLGTLRGFGVFDFFRMRGKKFSFLDDHLDRFERSQKFMGLSNIIDRDEIKDAINTLADWNNMPDSGFKLVLLANGDDLDSRLSPLFYILHSDLSKHIPPVYGGVILHEYVREYPLIKSINYFTSNLLHRKRIMSSAIDVVYHSNDLVSEASRSNIFIVKDGKLLTPGKNILEGVTRKQVLKFAPEFIPIAIEDLRVADLHSADEVFISSTLKEICPIVEIDGKQIGSGKVGPYTRRINKRFQELVNDSLLAI